MTEQALLKAKVLAPHNGYRRSGVGFMQGENEVEVTAEQLEAIHADSLLKVMDVADHFKTAGANVELGNSEDTNDKPVDFDVSGLSEEVAPWVLAIHLQQQADQLKLNGSGVPDIASLEEAIELPGDQKPKLTAAIRDEAWTAYQERSAAKDGE